MASDCSRSISGGNPPPRGREPHGSRDATEPPFDDRTSPECRRDSRPSPRAAQQSGFGLVILSLFILVQAIDGAFTYFAVLRFSVDSFSDLYVVDEQRQPVPRPV